MITIVVNGKDREETKQRANKVIRLIGKAFDLIGVLCNVDLDSSLYLKRDIVKWQSDKRAFIPVIEDIYSGKACRLIHIMLPYVMVIEGTATDTIKNSDIP